MIYFISLCSLKFIHSITGTCVPRGDLALNVSGFIAQLVKASHRYREVTGWKPVEVLNFFRLLDAIV